MPVDAKKQVKNSFFKNMVKNFQSLDDDIIKVNIDKQFDGENLCDIVQDAVTRKTQNLP